MIKKETRERWMEGWRKWRERPDVQRNLRLAQYALLAIIIVLLVYRLSLVGWREVLDNLPTSIWFYVFFLLRYFALPLSEIPTYELVWDKPLWRYFSAFVRKRVYNFAVMGYSGEAFFTLWARRRLGLPDKVILTGVKDNNLLSALVSNLATVILIVILAVSGGLKPGLDALPGSRILFSLAFLSAFSLSIAVIIFRNKLMDLPKGIMPKLVGIHAGRMVIILFLHAAMYAAALPGAPLLAWFMFIALQLVISRIPFVPNQDLVFLTAALSLSPLVGAPEAAIAGMLVAEAGLSQILNFSLFLATANDARQHRSVSKSDLT
ncbi:MAG: hypothetical protein AAFR21_00660 [Pseudomonadota bacterium]